ncbi:MAG TPA: Gfo/Idh/MocA family oxidoreductase [Tepidisphaeraceae bacterium]|jgi:predicted dehydrogenase|nr:Gfo/Idh/MocA family oxidoreductase [Tepidisphaeraceae bacterium]
MTRRFCLACIVIVLSVITARATDTPVAPAVIRVGIIGLDTSHVTAFTKILNDPKAQGDLAGLRVVAAFPGGSPDIESSRTRIDKFTQEIRGMNVEIVDSIPALLGKVDVVLLESVDGRPHLAQAKPVFEAGKPVFIDKPLAGSLADVIAISELAARHKTPWFSSSSLRYDSALQALKHEPKLGDIVGCQTWGPCPLEKNHPDLFWYGIHGCEMLYTVMGTGCQTVTRVHTEGTDVVTGVWKEGRVGTFRGIRAGKADYGAIAFGSKGIVPVFGDPDGYKPLVVQIARFFKTRQPPIAAEETIELYAFMEAADESKRQGGAPVKLETVVAKAREEAKARLETGK